MGWALRAHTVPPTQAGNPTPTPALHLAYAPECGILSVAGSELNHGTMERRGRGIMFYGDTSVKG